MRRLKILPCLTSLLIGGFAALPAPSQTGSATVPALLASDIHFEPFFDPAKTPSLLAAPPDGWAAILAAPASPGREKAYASLLKSCSSPGVDTSFALLRSTLGEMRRQASQANFIAFTGDMLSEDFECKYQALFPHSAPGDYRAFTEKTIAFVLREIRAAFPATPVYASLGNNDSGCGDNRLDANSEFLAAVGAAVVQGLPVAERTQALHTFRAGGYYAVPMAGVPHARVLVLGDLFMKAKFANCAGHPDPAPAAAQLAWLRQQLQAARTRHENVWVVGHVPPGLSPLSLAGAATPGMYLATPALYDTLAQYGDVVRLALFGHTHMDELRLIEAQPAIPLKIVPSVTPNTYSSAFLTARVARATAQLADYQAFTAANALGGAPHWSQEYQFTQAYRLPAFSPTALAQLIAQLHADPKGSTQASQNMMKFYTRQPQPAGNIQSDWPEYVCALAADTPAAFQNCLPYR